MKTRIAYAYVVVAGALMTTRAPADLSEGLVAYYPLDGDATDASSNGHDGVIHGATPAPDRFGTPDAAFRFDGDDTINVLDDAALTFGSDPFTVAAWVQISAFGRDGGYYLMGHSSGPGNTNKWIFWLGTGGISFVVGPAPGWMGLGTHDFEIDRWYHVAIRRDGEELTAFVDGSPIGSRTGPLPIPDPRAPLQIGTAELGRPNRPFRGLIDDVRVYRRALDVAEIGTLARTAQAVRWEVADGGNGHVYEAVLVPEGISWAAADGVARGRGCGWHLATISSAQENAFIYGLVNENPAFWNCCFSGNSAGPWLGGQNVGNGWEWVTGEPFDYTNWGPREPFGNGDRIGLFGYQSLMGPHWNDIFGNFPVYGYILERDVENVGPDCDDDRELFRRGDANQSWEVDISDAVATLEILFLTNAPLPCEDAADSNDDGLLDITDAVVTVRYLFAGSASIADPGPLRCGLDPTPDELGCRSYPQESCR